MRKGALLVGGDSEGVTTSDMVDYYSKSAIL